MKTNFVQFEIAPEIEADGDILPGVEEATRKLQTRLGKSAGRVRVFWESAGQNLVRLKLADTTGEASTVIAAKDIQEGERRLLRKIWRVWGELLDIRMERIMNPGEAGIIR